MKQAPDKEKVYGLIEDVLEQEEMLLNINTFNVKPTDNELSLFINALISKFINTLDNETKYNLNNIIAEKTFPSVSVWSEFYKFDKYLIRILRYSVDILPKCIKEEMMKLYSLDEIQLQHKLNLQREKEIWYMKQLAEHKIGPEVHFVYDDGKAAGIVITYPNHDADWYLHLNQPHLDRLVLMFKKLNAIQIPSCYDYGENTIFNLMNAKLNAAVNTHRSQFQFYSDALNAYKRDWENFSQLVNLDRICSFDLRTSNVLLPNINDIVNLPVIIDTEVIQLGNVLIDIAALFFGLRSRAALFRRLHELGKVNLLPEQLNCISTAYIDNCEQYLLKELGYSTAEYQNKYSLAYRLFIRRLAIYTVATFDIDTISDFTKDDWEKVKVPFDQDALALLQFRDPLARLRLSQQLHLYAENLTVS